MKNLVVAIQDACDALLGALYYPIVCLMLAGMTLFTVVRGRAFADAWDEWMVADWLINYASGFVRRGLSGELILRGSEVLGVRANTAVFAVIVGLSLALCLLFAVILRRRRITFWYFWLCLSPACLLFTYYDPFALGRKELLVFVAFGAWVLMLLKRGHPSLRATVAFSVAAFLITLMHEAFTFYSPYFVAAAFVPSRLRGDADRWRSSLLIPACSAAALLVTTIVGGLFSNPAVCQRLIAVGAPAAVCSGVLSYDATTTGEAFGRFLNAPGTVTAAGLAGIFPVVLLPVGLFLTANAPTREARRTLVMLASLIMLSLPLFVIGEDWGRWISMHVVLSTLLASLFLEEKRAVPDPQTDTGSPLLLAAGLFALAVMFLWSLQHCCQAEYFVVLGPARRLLP